VAPTRLRKEEASRDAVDDDDEESAPGLVFSLFVFKKLHTPVP
jgi:hypothetical protein